MVARTAAAFLQRRLRRGQRAYAAGRIAAKEEPVDYEELRYERIPLGGGGEAAERRPRPTSTSVPTMLRTMCFRKPVPDTS